MMMMRRARVANSEKNNKIIFLKHCVRSCVCMCGVGGVTIKITSDLIQFLNRKSMCAGDPEECELRCRHKSSFYVGSFLCRPTFTFLN